MSIKQIGKDDKYPFSKGQLTSLLAKRKENGLYKAVCQVGRRIYLKENLFDFWLDSHLPKADDPSQFIIKEKALIPIAAPIIKEKEGTVCINDELDLNIDTFHPELSGRTLTVLKAKNVKIIKDLCKLTEKELLETRHFGPKGVKR